MRKTFVCLVCLLMMSSVALASPLMDFTAGKGSIDLTWRNAENTVDGLAFDKKYNLDGAITLGLGNKWAFQYRNFEPKSKDMSAWVYDPEYDMDIYGQVNTKLAFNEFNVLYKLDKNVAALAGMVTAKATANFSGRAYQEGGYEGSGSFSTSTNTKNLWQVGLVASTELAPKTTLYGMAAAGANLTNFAVGVSYEFAPNLELDVNYRTIEAKKLKYEGVEGDVKAQGFGFGITYKF